MSPSQMNSHQYSMTEWFAAIGKQEESEALRQEDYSRTERFRMLQNIIGIVCDVPVEFPAVDVINKTLEFQKILEAQGDLPSAIRLVPKNAEQPKLRHRGPPLNDCLQWLIEQNIDFTDYTAEIFRHHDKKSWSTTFVVKENGIYGVLVRGTHTQLTHGETEFPIYEFRYDFKDWYWNEVDKEAEEIIKKIINTIKVTDPEKQFEVERNFQVKCFSGYVEGYWEVTIPELEPVILFIDHNRILHKNIAHNLNIGKQTAGGISGMVAVPGKVKGKAVIVNDENVSEVFFDEGDVLITNNTDVRYLPLMKKAGAIVTNQGGILTHAAIISRELKKVCLVGVNNATEIFKTGQIVEVDGYTGQINLVVAN